VLDKILLALQGFQVLFLLIHDWIPLGRLNDVAAVLSQDTLGRLVRVTAIQTIPFAIGLYFSARYFGAGYPHGSSCGCGLATRSYSSASFAPGGCPTF
jgi:hypothetical protein